MRRTIFRKILPTLQQSYTMKPAQYNSKGEKWCCRCEDYHNIACFKKYSGYLRTSCNLEMKTQYNIEQAKLAPPINTIYEVSPPPPGKWKYIMPDAYQNYIASLPINHISESDYKLK